MRWVVMGMTAAVIMSVHVPGARAEEKAKTSDRIVGGVISGLLGGSQPAPDVAYAAQERERLASLLQSGDYVTSRQGEPIELVVLGVPLTRADHVYTAKPIPPSQSGAR